MKSTISIKIFKINLIKISKIIKVILISSKIFKIIVIIIKVFRIPRICKDLNLNNLIIFKNSKLKGINMNYNKIWIYRKIIQIMELIIIIITIQILLIITTINTIKIKIRFKIKEKKNLNKKMNNIIMDLKKNNQILQYY